MMRVRKAVEQRTKITTLALPWVVDTLRSFSSMARAQRISFTTRM
jgi:hypothetical protein